MYGNNEIALKTLKILSDINSDNLCSGALIINGGIGCKNTINCKKLNCEYLYVKNLNVENINSINLDNLIVDKIDCNELNINNIIANKINCENINFKFLNGDNLVIDKIKSNYIESNYIENVYKLNVNNIISNNINVEILNFNNLLPIKNNENIGNNDLRVNLFSNLIISNNINSIYLENNNNVKLTKNNDKYIFETDYNEKALKINIDLFLLNGNYDNFEISDDGIDINGLLILNYKLIDNCYNSNIIFPIKSFVIICNNKYDNFILSTFRDKEDDCEIKDGSYLKIINFRKKNCLINNNYNIPPNTYIELFFIKNKWLNINKLETYYQINN
jgi:hypothetical protein